MDSECETDKDTAQQETPAKDVAWNRGQKYQCVGRILSRERKGKRQNSRQK